MKYTTTYLFISVLVFPIPIKLLDKLYFKSPFHYKASSKTQLKAQKGLLHVSLYERWQTNMKIIFKLTSPHCCFSNTASCSARNVPPLLCHYHQKNKFHCPPVFQHNYSSWWHHYSEHYYNRVEKLVSVSIKLGYFPQVCALQKHSPLLICTYVLLAK